jgi:hypothetical protein
MKKILLVLGCSLSLSVFAQPETVVNGASYLEPGEEIFHVMDTSGLKEGDIIIVRDKRDPSIVLKARVKNVKERSAIIHILPTE